MRPLLALGLAALLAGCADASSRHVVYVESNGHDRLVFEIRVDSELVHTATLDDSGAVPNVEKVYEREARQERKMTKTIGIRETTLGLEDSVQVPTGLSRFVIAEVYANDTMEVWALDHEPLFD